MEKSIQRLGVSFAIASITGYQKYVSPYKGFSCAHRVFYGGESCSQYVKRILGEVGFSEAITASRRRFSECREAHHKIKAFRFANSNEHSQDDEQRRQTNEKNLSSDEASRLARCGCDGVSYLFNGCLDSCGGCDSCGSCDSVGSCDFS